MILEINNQFIFETQSEIKRYHKNSIIIHEGSTSMFFYYLIEGELSVYNFTPEGKEFLQHKVKENHFFGEMFLKKNIVYQLYTIIYITSRYAMYFLICTNGVPLFTTANTRETS